MTCRQSFVGVLVVAVGVLFAGSSVAQQSPPAQGAPSKTARPAAAAKKAVLPGPRLGLEPRAIEILKASSARLAAARTMKFTAVVAYESPSRLGLALVYTTKSDVTLQRPDKFKVVTPGDGPASEFYYDGKVMTAFAPGENLVAVSDAPATIDAALAFAQDSAAIYFPFSDVMVADPYQDIAGALKIAFYVGQSNVIGGTTTDIVAFGSDDVFVQAWIGADDKLPRMMRAVYLKDRSRLRHVMELSNWQLDTALPPGTFVPTNAATAAKIGFAHPAPALPRAAKPAAKSSPGKTPPPKAQ